MEKLTLNRILSSNHKNTKGKISYPRTHLILAGGLTIALGFGLLLPSSQVIAKRISMPLGLEFDNTLFNDEPDEIETATNNSAQHLTWKKTTVKSGDTLSTLFDKLNLSSRETYLVANAGSEGKELTKIHPGKSINIAVNGQGQLQRLEYVKTPLESILVTLTDKGFQAENIVRIPEIRNKYTSGTIDSSLFLAGQNADLSQNMIMQLANIFGWDVDFILDIRSGDSFNLLYEEHYLDGDKIGDGSILSAQFINQGNAYTAVRYTDKTGASQYYTPEGLSMRKEFLRSPLDFTRISSGFDPNRKHPILNTIRAHKGVDYAASTGTPIRAAGDGKVIFAGKKGGYGNVLIIQHGQKYSTLYAHLNAFNKSVKVGRSVTQGQTVAYVGKSGLATGPHLHYEFRANGVHVNPLTVKLPTANPVPEQENTRFLVQTGTVLAQLKTYQQNIQLAQGDF